MPEPQPFIVGRENQVEEFAQFVGGEARHWVLNIFGPGGIGKSVVCGKFIAYASANAIPFAMVDGTRPDLTPDAILYAIMEGVVESSDPSSSTEIFRDLRGMFADYQNVQLVLQRGGGVPALFDVVGNVREPQQLAQITAGLDKPISSNVERTLSNRFALERYLRGVDKSLTASLMEGLSIVMANTRKPLALFVDTYEEMEGLDDWVCRSLAPTLPSGVKLVILGRNALPKVNFDWKEFADEMHTQDLPELPEADAKAYLAHYDLRDANARDRVYRFTGGYPLLLVLVVHLAREAGGWDKVGALESSADRDAIATQLLKRILREERANEVRDFLERGVIARWFNSEVIGVILEVNFHEARAIYDKLARHSFVERHPYGLKFHDKIRELLLERLKFTSESEYKLLSQRLMDYYAEKAGILIASETLSREATQLRELLARRLDLEELRTLCFDLNVDFDSLPGEGKAGKARELVAFLERRQELERLTKWLGKNRPDILLPNKT